MSSIFTDIQNENLSIVDNVCNCFNEISTFQHECSCFMFRRKRQNLLKRLRKLSEHEGSREDENALDIKEFTNCVLKNLKNSSLERLVKAIEDKNTSISDCVPIEKDMCKADKRFQHLQVAFCKLWRWPELDDNSDLRSLPFCFASSESEVCCNPYHWSIALQAGNYIDCT